MRWNRHTKFANVLQANYSTKMLSFSMGYNVQTNRCKQKTISSLQVGFFHKVLNSYTILILIYIHMFHITLILLGTLDTCRL